MNIQLKNIKVNLAFSEETNCFTANVYVNGKKAGSASNRGHGGCTDVYIEDKKLREELENYFKSLPAKDIDLGHGHVLTNFQETLDSHIDDLVYNHLKQKEDEKMKKKEIKIKKDNDLKGFPVTLKFSQGQAISYVGVKSESQIPQIAKKYNVSESLISKVEL